MGKRAFSLDALRGYAIVTMILSGTVASGILPGWMYHAQLPPPTNVFNPEVYGITWVDLVFPFFLFAMGAAFPFSLGSKIEKGVPFWKLSWDSFKRGLKLTFFAIFLQHMYPWVIASPQNSQAWLTTLLAFVLLFPMFMRLPWKMPDWLRYAVEIVAYIMAAVMMLNVHYANDRVFSLNFSNIIILVLGNMAIFGALCYIFTYNKPLIRLAILPFIMAIFLGSQTDGSWQKAVMDFSPVPWMYKFYYLKYLFIVIPGSIAGEYLKQWLNSKDPNHVNPSEAKLLPWLLAATLGIIVLNLYCLYMRYLVLNLFASTALIGLIYGLLRGKGADCTYWNKLFRAGTYLLLLGLFFEAYEGGIRKDSSTYSYYFVTTGLAFFGMIALSIMCDLYKWKALKPFEQAGQNPMIAYVAPNMVVMPLLNLSGLSSYLVYLTTNPWLGFFRGLFITTLAVLVALFFTRIKWFWRT